MSIDLIQKAVSVTGSQAEFARRLGVTPPFITKLLKTGVVPASRCYQIERITCGQVTAVQLRPDVFQAMSEIKQSTTLRCKQVFNQPSGEKVSR